MQIFNMHEAKTNLSKIILLVQQGQEVLIGKAGSPVARIVPFDGKIEDRKAGQLKGKIKIEKDFDELPEEFMEHFS